jgi:hypothetical protein
MSKIYWDNMTEREKNIADVEEIPCTTECETIQLYRASKEMASMRRTISVLLDPNIFLSSSLRNKE